MHETYIDYDSIRWGCTYEYEAAQSETDIDPSIPSIVTLCEAYVNGVELYEHLSVHTICALEALIKGEHE